MKEDRKIVEAVFLGEDVTPEGVAALGPLDAKDDGVDFAGFGPVCRIEGRTTASKVLVKGLEGRRDSEIND